jgi:CRP/FNR family cyclic AMP-dependent transcriptional regulator
MTSAVAERISTQPFFAPLTDGQRTALAENGTPVTFPAGARVFTEGDAADRFWLVEQGSVALDMRVPGRGDQTLETIAAGAVLGWSWLYPPRRWHFGAVARLPTVAIAFDATAIRSRCDADPTFGYAVLSLFTPVIIERLQAARLRLLDLYASPAQAGSTEARP